MSYQKKLTSPIRFLVFIAVILTFFVRPFALGLDHSLLTNALLLIVSGIVSMTMHPTLYNRKIVLFSILSIYIVFGVYSSIQHNSISSSFLPVLQVVSVYLLFRNYDVMRLFFKYLKNAFLFLIILAIINFTLENFYGDRDTLLLISNIKYVKDTYEFSLYFPLTWSTMGWSLDGSSFFAGIHSRQYYFFIEPGMAPTFFTACIYILWSDEKEKYKVLQTIIFLIGIFLTFSTGGPLILLLSLSAWFLAKRKKKFSILTIILVVAGVYVAWYAYNYMPFFGRQAKLELSAGTQTSIETHETIMGNVLVGVSMLVFWGLLTFKIKKNKVYPAVIAIILALGYMSNYVGFTTLATMFLFWDHYMFNKPEDKLASLT